METADQQTTTSLSSSWVPSEIPQPFQNLSTLSSKKVFCFGSGDGDEEYLLSCGWSLASSIDEADLIVARGTFVVLDATSCADKKVDGEEAYWKAHNDALEKASKKNIPMIVCNPDKIRPDADRSPMPGSIAVYYEQLLRNNNNNNDDGQVAELLIFLLLFCTLESHFLVCMKSHYVTVKINVLVWLVMH